MKIFKEMLYVEFSMCFFSSSLFQVACCFVFLLKWEIWLLSNLPQWAAPTGLMKSIISSVQMNLWQLLLLKALLKKVVGTQLRERIAEKNYLLNLELYYWVIRLYFCRSFLNLVFMTSLVPTWIIKRMLWSAILFAFSQTVISSKKSASMHILVLVVLALSHNSSNCSLMIDSTRSFITSHGPLLSLPPVY